MEASKLIFLLICTFLCTKWCIVFFCFIWKISFVPVGTSRIAKINPPRYNIGIRNVRKINHKHANIFLYQKLQQFKDLKYNVILLKRTLNIEVGIKTFTNIVQKWFKKETKMIELWPEESFQVPIQRTELVLRRPPDFRWQFRRFGFEVADSNEKHLRPAGDQF